MAIVTKRSLFSWKEIENLGDLDRLFLAVRYLPDEELMRDLERHRRWGRNDYPVRAVWNSLLAGIIYEHNSIQRLRRELSRNGQMRDICGFDPLKGKHAVPPAYVYSRFFDLLFERSGQVQAMFDKLVRQLKEILPEFGRRLAIDSKAVESHGNSGRDHSGTGCDRRRDTDADMGVKTYRGIREDGSRWEKTFRWFGYKIHLIVDAFYELPVAYEVTKASRPDIKEGRDLFDKLAERQSDLVDQSDILTADRGYDDTAFIRDLWEDRVVKPVIDIRNMWKDGEETKLIEGRTNVVYDYCGTVYCHCPRTGRRQEMSFGGFEADRNTLKYRCPAVHYGMKCPGRNSCPVKKAIRISLSEDSRIFTPIARSSYKWAREYKTRTSVERVNSRLDVSFGFEEHFIRGQKKMKLRTGLALIVMLALALGHVKEKRRDRLRSLVSPAA